MNEPLGEPVATVEVDEVIADGTVTKDEAKAVHKAMRGNHKGHKKGAAKKNG